MIPPWAIAQASYVGSARCGSCHKSNYENWKGTLHNKSQQELSPTNDTVVVNWEGTVKLKAGKIPEVTIKLNELPERVHRATLVDAKDPSKEVTYTVVRTYGGWGWKQRYQVKIGKQSLHTPYSMEPGNLSMGSLQSAKLVQRGRQSETTRRWELFRNELRRLS